MAREIPAFDHGTIEFISQHISDIFTGSQITQILRDSQMAKHDICHSDTKWKRLAQAVATQQQRQRDGRPLIKLLKVSFDPKRVIGNRNDVDTCRNEINTVLSLSGFKVQEDGQVARSTKTKTVTEARQRSEQLRKLLKDRGAHQEVLRHCRPQLLKNDYYEAVFESIKGLGDRLREMGSVDQDGRALVQHLLGSKNARLKLNENETKTQKNEQEGTALLAEGLFAAFRNPGAHEPRLKWHLSEQDALDVLGLVSLIHRRLDNANRL